jgi:hypothetical protein
MRLSPLPRRLVLSYLLVLLVLTLPELTTVHTQTTNPCPEPTFGKTFEQGDTIYLDLGPFPDNVKEQIKRALGKWDFANTHNNTSNVRFNTTVNPWTLPGHPSLIHVAKKTFFNPDGSVDHTTVAETIAVRWEGNNLREVTVFFNEAVLANPSDPNSGPYQDPTQPGYDTVFEKTTLHEVGHPMGLDDVPVERRQAGASVMNLGVPNCPNDQAPCGKKPTDIQPCDNDAINGILQFLPPPPPPASPTPTPCTDQDNDGWCQQLDCNDSNPWAFRDGDGDGYCEDIDCDDNDPAAHPGAYLGLEPTPGDDKNCNNLDDFWEVSCGPIAEQRCRAAGKNWEGAKCQCNFFSDPSPILIDVMGNGFNLTAKADGVTFDLNNDGVKEQLSWTAVNSDDAWLALDRNGNGTIDGGIELFGNFTPQPTPPPGEEKNGFLALAEYDKTANGGNGDGVISRADAIFNSLRLWQDLNHNGISEPLELFSLDAVGLSVIELNYKESKKTDQYGNEFRYRARVRDARGAQLKRWAWDVFLL